MSSPLAEYTFFPWVRLGAAGEIATVDPISGAGPANPRAAVSYQVTLNQTTVTKQVRLYGPADIIGIDESMIIRREPVPHAANHLSNELAFVDFAAEDFPWRYTPAKATTADKLRPWLCLAVLEESERTNKIKVGAPLPVIEVSRVAALPIPDQLWAWAHVQVAEGIEAAGGEPSETALKTLLADDPRLARSRILSPRRLLPGKKYYAYLVPTFEVGRKAGLGLPIGATDDALAPAWTAAMATIELPVYHAWEFQTSREAGDFEYLVSILVPRAMSPSIGIRDMDVGSPGMGLPPARTGVPVLGLEAALRSPSMVSTVWPNPTAFRTAIQNLIDVRATQLDNGSTDPVVTLPLYGGAHSATRTTTNSPTWLYELNVDPRLRAAAGLGTVVVQRNQDRFMSEAWEQVGDIMRANELLRQARLSVLAEKRWYETELLTLDDDQFFSVVSAVLGRIPFDGSTLSRLLLGGRISPAVLDPVFRRAMRPWGPIRRRIAQPNQALNIISKLNDGTIEALSPKKLGTGAINFKTILLDARWSAALATDAKVNELLDESAFHHDYVAGIPGRPTMTWDDPVSGVEPSGPTDSPEVSDFRKAITDLIDVLDTTHPDEAPPAAVDLPFLRSKVAGALQPQGTVLDRVRNRLRLVDRTGNITALNTLDRIMKAPDLPEPMYTYLRDLDADLLMANLNQVPPNTISLLQTNQRFIEAFMVGLNHEMSRELLWREYPTDMRGSYFRQFWDPADAAPRATGETEAQREERLRNITPIHSWARTSAVGAHDPANPSQSDRVVLMIRGELLRRFPNVVISAVRAAWPTTPNPTRRDLTTEELFPIFGASAGTDVTFLGFNLTLSAARGSPDPAAGNAGWFFVLRERPGEVRFGLDFAEGPATQPATAPDQLSWGHVLASASFATAPQIDLSTPLTQVVQTGWPATWAASSEHMAYLLYQLPTMLAVHASQMLAGVTT